MRTRTVVVMTLGITEKMEMINKKMEQSMKDQMDNEVDKENKIRQKKTNKMKTEMIIDLHETLSNERLKDKIYLKNFNN